MVVTVSVEGVPGVTDARLKLQVGGLAVVGETAHVSATELLKPPSVAMVIVDVAEPPGSTAKGLNDEAEIVKLGVVEVGARALIRLVPFGLPHPVAKS